MDKVFRVELFGEKTNRWCELELPATYYGLLDALDKLQMTLGRSGDGNSSNTMALSSCKTIWPMNAISISLTLWQPVWDR